MRLPRLQFTVRRLMVAVAMMGVVLGVTIERRDRFRNVAAHHQAETKKLVSRHPEIVYGHPDDPIIRRIEWHEPMRLKDERAVRYPWLPVGLDPPDPKLVLVDCSFVAGGLQFLML
jgi:hypothetical protein